MYLNNEVFNDIKKNLKNNSTLSKFFYRLGSEESEYKQQILYRKGMYIENCSNWWNSYFFRMQNVKAVKKISLCHDRYCKNCQNVITVKRYLKYKPLLDELSKTNDMYHFVLSIKNCEPNQLEKTIDKILYSFGQLVRYFRGNANINGIDLTQLGFLGAVRSLEVTYNAKKNTFHPHLHCILILGKDISKTKLFKKNIINKFSWSYKMQTNRKFSNIEVIIQKMWYMLNNNIKINSLNLFNSDSYSCTLDLITDGNYKEVFKYILKSSDKLDYDNFKILYKALESKRQYQSYGVLRKYDFNDYISKIVKIEDLIFNEELYKLLQIEFPLLDYFESIHDVENNFINNKSKYLTKMSILNYVMSLTDDEQNKLKEKLLLNKPVIEQYLNDNFISDIKFYKKIEPVKKKGLIIKYKKVLNIDSINRLKVIKNDLIKNKYQKE